jgi:Na+-transporting methylmalonyl-CoA/oxaloacetate decarboxylase gamma subunit
MDILFTIVVVFLLVLVLAMQFQIGQLSKKIDHLLKPKKTKW